jgi:hypothetical protein
MRGSNGGGAAPSAEAPTAGPAAPTAAPAAPNSTPAATPNPPSEAEQSSLESDQSVEAHSGQLTKIDAYFSLTPDCSSAGYAEIGVKIDVQNGTFSARKGKDHPTFPSDSDMKKCNRRLIPSTQLYYQSNKGYTGSDTLSIKITLASGKKMNVTYNITVRWTISALTDILPPVNNAVQER